VRLVYLDDSAQDGLFQVIAAVMVRDYGFMDLERTFGILTEATVPEELQPSFEFHTSDIFQGNPPFDKLDKDKALAILDKFALLIGGTPAGPIPIVYGAVDVRDLRAGDFATAQPMDIAFRRCIRQVEMWLKENADHDFGILISDDTSNNKQKESMQAAFRAYRARIKTNLRSYPQEFKAERGKGAHLHDDMYFGNSSYSVGLQLADFCAFIILRHLQGKEDTEFLYKKIEKYIYSMKVEP
jgi:uncharacterized protein DUF3800